MSRSSDRDAAARRKPAAGKQRPRHTSEPDNESQLQDDESGNRALHSVAAGANPNVGREDIERPAPERSRDGGIESA
jgi:hypothetical protein